MIASIQDLIVAVSEALRDDVLPHVEATMPASNIRACLMLLAYAGDRIVGEGKNLSADATALRGLFRGILTDPAMPPLDQEGRARIEAVLADHPEPVGYQDIDDLTRTCLAFQGVLTPLIRTRFEARAMLDPVAYAYFRTRVDTCLMAISDRAVTLARRAATEYSFL